MSVIIPAYNAETTIRATLRSVRQQTMPPSEIIIVDDGSTDATPRVVAEFAAEYPTVRIIRQPNAGVAAARNAGIAAATGRWVASLDADDVWHPRWIELMRAAAEAAPAPPGFVYCWSRRIDGDGRVLSDMGCPTHAGDVFAQLVAGNFLRNASSALLRRDVVLAVGGFDPGLRAQGAQGAEDLKLYLAIARREPVAVAPYFLTGYRVVAGSMSRSPARMRRSIEIVLADLEAEGPPIPPALMRLARMNYDMYAAALALFAGRTREFASYVGSGIRRAPLSALVLLGVNAVWRVQHEVAGPKARPPFASLAPTERLPMALMPAFSRHQARAAARAQARGRAAPAAALPDDV